MQDYDLKNGFKVTINLISFKPVTMINPLQFDENTSIWSGNIPFLAMKPTSISWPSILKMGPRSPNHSQLFRLS